MQTTYADHAYYDHVIDLHTQAESTCMHNVVNVKLNLEPLPQVLPCLPLQAERHAFSVLYEAVRSALSEAAYPSSWQPQFSDTEIFEVPQNSPEVMNLVASVRRAGGIVVKVSVSGNCNWVGVT